MLEEIDVSDVFLKRDDDDDDDDDDFPAEVLPQYRWLGFDKYGQSMYGVQCGSFALDSFVRDVIIELVHFHVNTKSVSRCKQLILAMDQNHIPQLYDPPKIFGMSQDGSTFCGVHIRFHPENRDKRSPTILTLDVETGDVTGYNMENVQLSKDCLCQVTHLLTPQWVLIKTQHKDDVVTTITIYRIVFNETVPYESKLSSNSPNKIGTASLDILTEKVLDSVRFVHPYGVYSVEDTIYFTTDDEEQGTMVWSLNVSNDTLRSQVVSAPVLKILQFQNCVLAFKPSAHGLVAFSLSDECEEQIVQIDFVDYINSHRNDESFGLNDFLSQNGNCAVAILLNKSKENYSKLIVDYEKNVPLLQNLAMRALTNTFKGNVDVIQSMLSPLMVKKFLPPKWVSPDRVLGVFIKAAKDD